MNIVRKLFAKYNVILIKITIKIKEAVKTQS